jgi:hypothetical protein
MLRDLEAEALSPAPIRRAAAVGFPWPSDSATNADEPCYRRSSNPQLLEDPIEAPGFVGMQGSADLSGPASLTLAWPDASGHRDAKSCAASRLLKSGAVIH